MEAVIENTFSNVKTSKERKNKITRDIIEGKYTCTSCCISMEASSYYKHIKSKNHIEGKTKCECGGFYYLASFSQHEEATIHKQYLEKIREKKNKLEQYEINKDESNCCSNCHKINISDRYYIPELKLCKCCDEIIEGGIKRCIDCKEKKEIKFFEKPYLIRCKKCATKKTL